MPSILSPLPVYIYALVDPTDNRIRYIGKTHDPRRRYQRHLLDKEPSSYKANWIKGLLRCGLAPRFLILETVLDGRWAESERAFIAHHRELGCDLTNQAEGGRGSSGWKHTAQTRALVSARVEAKPRSLEHAAKISAAKRGKPGKPLSAAAKAKLSAYWTGRKRPAEEIARRAATQRGRPAYPLTPEGHARLVAANRARRPGPMSDQAKAKLSAAKKGKPVPALQGREVSAQTRAKLSAAKKGRPNPKLRGRVLSAQTRAKISEARRGKPSPRKGQPSPLRGRKLSAEVRAKISATKRKRATQATQLPLF